MTEETRLVLQPGQIGTLEIPNRIVLPPMLMGYGTEDGFVTERAKDYYEARARGGVGLVIVEAAMPQPAGKMFRYYLDASDDRYLPGLAELAAVIKRHGARAAIQLGDGGRETRFEMTGRKPMGPSAIAARKREAPIEMTREDIARTVRLFAEAVDRAKRAGFEGVEIHAAHVYLLNQFLSEATNVRTDDYGGSVANRTRILVEMISEARSLVGDDYPIWVRINGMEYGIENGITLEQSKEIAQLLAAAGSDAISVSAGSTSYEASMQSTYIPQGRLVPVAAAIKAEIDVPVIVVGRMTPDFGEGVLARGDADFIAIGRGLMADADLVTKFQEGRAADIVPCVCELNCVQRGVLRDQPITCSVNPALGRERELELRPAETQRSVAVIGGGPAGLEAARVAALRGHRVTLFEKDEELGGHLRAVRMAPSREDIQALIDYYEKQLRDAGVEIQLGKTARPEVLAGASYDVVIVATGAQRGQTLGEPDSRFTDVMDLLTHGGTSNKEVVIFGGGGRSCELADLLSEQGNAVTIVGRHRRLAPEIAKIVTVSLLGRLEEKNVRMLTEGQLGAITATAIDVWAGGTQVADIPADVVVFDHEVALDGDLLGEVTRNAAQTFVIGDAVRHDHFQDAIADGARVGRLV